jgi:hypothetical protein
MLGEVAAEEGAKCMMEFLRQSVLKQRQLGELSKDVITRLMEETFQAGHDGVLKLYSSAPATYDFPKGSK